LSAGQSRESKEKQQSASIDELREELDRKDKEYNSVHGENYRMKREVRKEPGCTVLSHA
jgi:hypothetical protein